MMRKVTNALVLTADNLTFKKRKKYEVVENDFFKFKTEFF